MNWSHCTQEMSKLVKLPYLTILRFIGSTLNSTWISWTFRCERACRFRENRVKRTGLSDEPLQGGDVLLVAGKDEHLLELKDRHGI